MTAKATTPSQSPILNPRVALASGAGEQFSSRYSSSDLFKGQNEIQIEHQGAEYRLRITRSGGLILNK